MNMHLSQTFSSHRAHFFPHRPTNLCRSSRASKRTTYTRRNNAEGGKGRMTTFQPPRITFQMNRPPRGPLFVFNISPVARAKDRPSFISRYHQLDPFFLSDRLASRPLYLSSARRCLISLARSLAGHLERGRVDSLHPARDVQNKSFINSIPRNPILSTY